MDAIRVLVVDDDFLAREMTKDMLEQIGCIIVGEAADGFEAIELSQALKPDVVLMDVDMPKMNGFEATPYCSMPVILLTTYSLLEIIDQAWAVGARACMDKQAKVDVLKQTVTTVATH